MPHDEPVLTRAFHSDVADVMVHKLLPGLARMVADRLPPSWIDETDENLAWGIALTLAPLLMNVLIPGRHPSLDNYRVAFFTNLGEAVKQRHAELKGGTADQTKRGKPMAEDQLAIIVRRKDGKLLATIHEMDCPVFIDQKTIEVGGEKKRRIPNPRIQLVPRGRGLMLKELKIGDEFETQACLCLKADGQNQKAAALPQSAAAVIERLEQDEKDEFYAMLGDFTEAEAAVVLPLLAQHLNTVDEAKALLALPADQRVRFAILIKDRSENRFDQLLDRAGGLAHNLGGVARGWRDEVRQIGAKVTAGLHGLANTFHGLETAAEAEGPNWKKRWKRHTKTWWPFVLIALLLSGTFTYLLLLTP
ncbi:hypothetical protein HY628_02300 [Candidatus Uhrbacteria bacterium]|nr:hypothetical protein [Candidatus Uhrbacteria bacterium]